MASATCAAIGDHGAALIRAASAGLDRPLNILTHCNAGWLATVDWGTALAPVYKAARAGVKLHVWVDETRPRNQGASLTAWELVQEKIPHTVIADNAGGHLMQHGEVDLVIAGRASIDAETGQVAPQVAEMLGWTFLGGVRRMSLLDDGGGLRVECEGDDGAVAIEAARGWLTSIVAAPLINMSGP